MEWLSWVFVMGFVVIHLFSKNMNFLKVVPRSRFLSIAGGISGALLWGRWSWMALALGLILCGAAYVLSRPTDPV